MDFERAVLEILLRRIRFEQISIHSSDGSNDYKGAAKDVFLQMAKVHLPNGTEDENEQLYCWARGKLENNAGIFHMILEAADAFLELRGNYFYYRDQNWTVKSQFFHWKELTAGMGQEIFTMALLARAYEQGNVQDAQLPLLLCQPFPRVGDAKLGELLGQDGGEGMTENHFHLKGSFPVFLLNWSCLMNHAGGRSDLFRRMEAYREEEWLTGPEERKRKSLFQASVAAASYRLHLYEVYSGVPGKMPFSYDRDPDETEIGMLRMQTEYYRGRLKPYWDGKQMRIEHGLDYALSELWDKCRGWDEVSVIGERYFLFRCFREIFREHTGFRTEDRNLFYKYLLISLRVRAELVQVNQMRGFGNFAAYQARKEDVIGDYPEYQSHVIRLTACSLRRWQNLFSMEMRISPKNNAGKALDGIRKYQEDIEKRVPKEERGAYFYVVHFPKKREWKWVRLQARNHKLRKEMDRQIEVQKQLIGIEQSDYETLGRLPMVRGYDTCSGEVGCRPEVFGQLYRSIQQFARDKGADWIHWTYHVGEDFLDLVDGLRAVNEAMLFCELPEGSRIGHGMALGLDASRYYELKQYRILLPGHDLLDNIAWTLGFCQDHGIVIRPGLEKRLEEEFIKLHEEIYGAVPVKKAAEGNKENEDNRRKVRSPSAEKSLAEREAAAAGEPGGESTGQENGGKSEMVKEADHGNNCISDFAKKKQLVDVDWLPYYNAWKLRGDRPEPYMEAENAVKAPLPDCGLRRGLDQIREDDRCRGYYSRYHFSSHVRERGEKQKSFRMDRAYMELIGRMQDELRYLLAEKKIGIECNPTSNYKIGPFGRFDEHPMLRMYGKNLEEGAASRMSISINTDDMGVFQTSLETEYAAMYVALLKSRDGRGNLRYSKKAVLKWLEDVKAFGHRQAFLMEEEQRV